MDPNKKKKSGFLNVGSEFLIDFFFEDPPFPISFFFCEFTCASKKKSLGVRKGGGIRGRQKREREREREGVEEGFAFAEKLDGSF